MAAFMLALLAAVGVGALAGQARTHIVAAPVLREEIGPVRIEGIIAEIDSSERSRRVRIDVRAIERLTPTATPDFVRFSFKGELGFEPGRAVAAALSCRRRRDQSCPRTMPSIAMRGSSSWAGSASRRADASRYQFVRPRK